MMIRKIMNDDVKGYDTDRNNNKMSDNSNINKKKNNKTK